ncbi:MAG: response regulator [Pseudobutyrivibrio sp.]|nr:response regulator [Pseudobutyrivibrio sp.]
MSKNTSPFPTMDFTVFILTIVVCLVYYLRAFQQLKTPDPIFEYYTYAFSFVVLLYGSYFYVVDSGVVPFYLPMAAVYIVFLLRPFPAILIMALTGIPFTLFRLIVVKDLIFTYAAAILVICLISIYGSYSKIKNFITLETSAQYKSRLLEGLAVEANDFIAVIYLDNEIASLHSGSWYGKDNPTPEDELELRLDEWIEKARPYFKSQEDAEKFKKIFAVENVKKVLSQAPEYEFSYDFVDKEGNTKRKQFKLAWLDETKKAVIVVRTDVTKSLREEHERNLLLSEALNEAKSANRAKMGFISRVSHDVRTPIGAIKNMAEFAIQDIDDRSKLEHDLYAIQNSSEYIETLLDDILDVTKIDAGVITLRPKPYGPEDFREDYEQIILPEAAKKNITVESIVEGENINIMVDQVRWRQISLNIIMNAIRYTPAGGKVSIKAGSKRINSEAVRAYIIVEDNGIGMTEEYMKNMFEAFSQDDSNPQRRKIGGGTGLGLYTAKRLLDLMGGGINVKSKLGAGTEVTVYVDTKIASEEDMAKASRERDTFDDKLKLEGKVLLAEDNEINTEIVMRILRIVGLHADHAWDGQEAIELFEKSYPGEYCAILMDLQMPVLSGFDATEKIRHMDREDAGLIPVIAMTADAYDSAKEKAAEVGFNSYITKPLDIRKVESNLAKYILEYQAKLQKD